jgi:hypothetical protein
MSSNEPKTEVMYVRCTPTLKARLVKVASNGPARDLADHIRYAIELYVADEERKNPMQTTVGEATNSN